MYEWNAEKMVKYTRWGHTRSKLYMKTPDIFTDVSAIKNPHSTKNPHVSHTTPTPPNSKKHTMSTENGWHTIPLSFSYTSHVNMLDWVNKCIEPPKILVVEWNGLFFS